MNRNFNNGNRGVIGAHHRCNKKHLRRYAAEFEFRYNNRLANGVDDGSRFVLIMIGAKGKRLTYRRAGVEIVLQ